MTQGDETSIMTITFHQSLACPQFQLPQSGSINYYSKGFSQPTALKLTACSFVVVHRGWGEQERERGYEPWITWKEILESKNILLLIIKFF